MGVFVGVDVGTGSARAAVFAADGRLLASHSRPIATWSPQPELYQQDSEAIWAACCTSVKVSMGWTKSSLLSSPEQYAGI